MTAASGSRDPPAYNLSRNDILVSQVSRERTSIIEFYNRSVSVSKDDEANNYSFGLEPNLRRNQGTLLETGVTKRLRELQMQRGMSLGEQKTRNKNNNSDDDKTASTGSGSVDGRLFGMDDNRSCTIIKPDSDDVREQQGGACSSPSCLVTGFFRTLVEFLTCAAVSSICATRTNKDQETANIYYEIPLHSVQDVDDIGAWGVGSKEQESVQPTRIAKAINFSSNRLDEKNAAIALYDKKKLRQEIHQVEIREDIFEGDANEEADDDFSCYQSQSVPQAIVVKPKKVDDISVLEDSSVDSLEDSRNVQAWSLSPRRKRRLKARARAIARKSP